MRSLWRIVKFTRHLWPYYLVVTFTSILVAIIAQALPLLTGAIVSQLQQIANGSQSNLIWLLIGLVFLQDVLSNIISNLQGYFGDLMSWKMRVYLGQKYYDHLLSLPQTYYDNELTGKITARLNRSVNQISSFANAMANNFSSFILGAVISLTILAFYSWPAALLMGSLYPIFTWLTIKTSGKWMKHQEKINQYQDLAYGRFQEVVGQVKVVKSFSRERAELGFFNRNMNRIFAQVRPQSRMWHVRDVQRRLVLNVIFGLSYAVIIWQTVEGQLSLAEAVMLLQLSTIIRFPIFTVSFLVENIQRAVADSRDYFEVMELQPDIKDRPGAKSLKVGGGEIEFKNLAFSYSNKSVIDDVSAVIHAGSKVALVGESGSGKTTITNLLLRLYEPDSGQILIDGQDIASVTQKSLRSQISMVFQDPSLFSGTIEENIAYGRSDYTQQQLVNAAKAANAHDFITKLDKGYKTTIGEKGLKLSGGQKQRIAIARAILKDAPILILDEATSSLDSKSEVYVQEALERLMQNRTTLIVAHRLSTIKSVDQILTFVDGKIDEQGSPKALSKTAGLYAKLLAIQTARNESERNQALKKFGLVS